jgi:hypothetical protein
MAEVVAMLTVNGTSSSQIRSHRSAAAAAAATPLATQDASSGAHGDSIYLT